MSKKKAAKPKTARGIRNLPAKKASAKQSQEVKGGSFLAGFKAGVKAGATTTPTQEWGIIKKLDKTSAL